MAILELVRHEYAYVRQEVPFGDIEVRFRASSRAFDFSSVDDQPTPRSSEEDARANDAA